MAGLATLQAGTLRIWHQLLAAICNGMPLPPTVDAPKVITYPWGRLTIAFAIAATAALAPFSPFALAFAFPGSFAVESLASDKGSNLAVGHLRELLGRE